ncbi:MAG: hypothetical protein BEN18_02155 [Epulopiscium sp. Nuni2H_MBin001]|nr:MAG: hypothetical protein BEN18_02155 [Epulopiscium sp. Nuni2H_MBin001]
MVDIILRTSTRYMLLERAIKDIANQTYKEWNIIVINDGGDKQKIHQILAKHNITSFKYLETKQQGLQRAINLGAKAVSSEFVVVHDDDDTWNPSFLSATIDFLQQDPNRMGVISQTVKVYEKIQQNTVSSQKKILYNPNLVGVISFCDMLKHNQFPPISFVYRSKVYNKIGYFDESLEVLEDWEFCIRFLSKYDIYIIPKPLAFYHIRIDNEDLPVVFQNTITHKRGVHLTYDTIIRNKYLREDLAKKQFGIGIMMNVLKYSDSKLTKKIKLLLRNIDHNIYTSLPKKHYIKSNGSR